ncbi:unnamed protein product [Thlaspi arvense]|uniref:FBD domain-containing protein n=1 Tax=Thlaspi arvense TaxID=13288 RepID=A0AAU9SP99_THLAR|nr:unnamed protein product [Thlaspi arvense]
MLPIILERCPNLKSLAVRTLYYEEKEGIHILPEPGRVLASLKYVKIERPFKVVAVKLVRYLLENSMNLKKLTLCLGGFKKDEESVVVKELLTIPRLSTSCQVDVL